MKHQVDVFDEIKGLIKDDSLSVNERQLLMDAQQRLDAGQNSEKVAMQLKSRLAILAVKKELSPAMVAFFTKLSQEHLGFGRRGMLNI